MSADQQSGQISTEQNDVNISTENSSVYEETEDSSQDISEEQNSDIPISDGSELANLEYKIYTEATIIETERFSLTIPANCYVPGTIVSDINQVMDNIEQVTGLSFYSDYAKTHGKDGKVEIIIKKPDSETEVSNAHGSVTGATVSPAHILLNHGYASAMHHELLHCINARNGHFMSRTLCEGFTTCLTQKMINEHYFISIFNGYLNFSSYEDITPETAENLFIDCDNDGWNAYLYGFRLMHYIIEKHGLDKYMELTETLDAEQTDFRTFYTNKEMVPYLKEHFGDDFFKEFGKWYQANKHVFEQIGAATQDFTPFNQLEMIPQYAAWTFYDRLSFTYQDTFTIDMEKGYEYMTAYKNETLSGNFVADIRTIGDTTVSFYNRSGELIQEEKLSLFNTRYNVPDVSCIKFTGDGKIVIFEPIFEEILMNANN